jgi:hypothetical protein
MFPMCVVDWAETDAVPAMVIRSKQQARVIPNWVLIAKQLVPRVFSFCYRGNFNTGQKVIKNGFPTDPSDQVVS